GGLPRLRFHESVGEQGRHAVFLRYLPEVRGRNFLEDRFADLGPQDHHLVYADAAGVARAVAFFAASPAVKLRHVRKLPGKELACEALGLRRGQRIRFFAMAADAAHEALAYSHVHRRGDEVGVDSHIKEARQRRRGVTRVERREDEVARERRVDGNRGGLAVADLADHDDVRVLAQDRAQPRAEREPRPGVDLDLAYAFDRIFDRILDRDDGNGLGVELLEERVERRRLAASGGAGRQYHAMRLPDSVPDLRLVLFAEAQALERELFRLLRQEAQHRVFAVVGRGDGDAHVDGRISYLHAEAAVLRGLMLVGAQVAQNLYARD